MTSPSNCHNAIDDLASDIKKHKRELITLSFGVVTLTLIFLPIVNYFFERDNSLTEYVFLCCMFGAGTWYRFNQKYRSKRAVLKKAQTNEEYLDRLIKEKHVYAFYLSQFSKGAERKLVHYSNGHSSGFTSIDGNLAFHTITIKLAPTVPVVCLYNNQEIGGPYKATTIVVNNQNWYERFCTIYQSCTYVIIDYGKSISRENVKLEIEYICSHPGKAILLVGTDSNLSLLEQHYPCLREQIVGQFSWVRSGEMGYHYMDIDTDDPLFDDLKNGSILNRLQINTSGT